MEKLIFNTLVDTPPYPEGFFDFKDLIIFSTSLVDKELNFIHGRGFKKFAINSNL
jgi:hypothetical protein